IELWSKPIVWRRIQVPANYTFWDLHCAIQDAMGWEGVHCHCFEFWNKETDKQVTIGNPDEDDMGEWLSEFEEKISNWFSRERAKASYQYDFGDSWSHEVLLEEILPAADDVRYPV